MNKTAIKTFAIEARKKLIASVKDKAGLLGIINDEPSKPEQKGAGFEVYRTHAGTENKIFEREMKQRQSLVNRIKEYGYDHVMEEVAYTWFNRIIAIRFMEVNDYLPARVRVLSSETIHKIEPDIVTLATNIDLGFTNSEKEKIYTLKSENKLDELFSMLFIKQCNKLGDILPELFEKVEDYTELLLNVSYTNQDGVIRILIDNIEEDDFKEAVEIIGWLYQYYNTEVKDYTFSLLKNNVKITKERIPAATQLFTPDWIVRYMVENSLGRLWLEHLKSENKTENHDKIDSIKANWKYYLDEAEQDKEVQLQLNQSRKKYKDLKAEDIKIIDPCMGSGHILVYAFDVFMNMYRECGYLERDAAKLIVQKNLYGLEIDDRAYQLAYFAVMMKGRKYDRRFLTRGIKPNLCSIQESNTVKTFEQGAGQQKLSDLHKETANYLIKSFKDAKEYGSILNIEQRDYDGLLAYIEEMKQNGAEDLFISLWLNKISDLLTVLIKQAKIMSQKYDVVITNPPYMGSNGMDAKLSEFVKKEYPDSKSDLFAVCIEKGNSMLNHCGYNCMVTMQSWMFLSSFEKMRAKILSTKTITNLLHMENMVMGIAFGTAVSIVRNCTIEGFKGTYNHIKIADIEDGCPKEFPVIANRFAQVSTENFSKIPGMPIAYWVSDNIFNAFINGENITKFIDTFQGIITGDNNKFLRLWFEPNLNNVALHRSSMSDIDLNSQYWIPYNKGGEFRNWYGNQEYVVYWKNGPDDKTRGKKSFQDYYLREYVSWSYITSSTLASRYFPCGFLWDVSGSGIFDKSDMLFYLQCLIGSKVGIELLKIINPTINYQVENIAQLPVLIDKKEIIDALAKDNITISKGDWDNFETSWDFKKHPFIIYKTNGLIAKAFESWELSKHKDFLCLKSNEEKVNRIFIEIYGLQDELTSDVEDKDVTIRKADLGRDARSFISYAVGCMFGRYSIDVDGLAYAGGEWDVDKYGEFIPDKDNIIPITDEEYFEDDIVGLFCAFLKKTFGAETFKDNLNFIAQALGNKGVSSKEIIRNYFVKDFFKDHLKVYQKRPIYWQFDSGKENGFKALIYMHRYDQDTVGRVRADYLHKTQAALENAIKSSDYVIETTSSNSEKAKATKAREKYIKQLSETKVYDEAIAYIAHRRIQIDLDEGVKVNYSKFQNVEVKSEGKKTQKINLLTTI